MSAGPRVRVLTDEDKDLTALGCVCGLRSVRPHRIMRV